MESPAPPPNPKRDVQITDLQDKVLPKHQGTLTRNFLHFQDRPDPSESPQDSPIPRQPNPPKLANRVSKRAVKLQPLPQSTPQKVDLPIDMQTTTAELLLPADVCKQKAVTIPVQNRMPKKVSEFIFDGLSEGDEEQAAQSNTHAQCPQSDGIQHRWQEQTHNFSQQTQQGTTTRQQLATYNHSGLQQNTHEAIHAVVQPNTSSVLQKQLFINSYVSFCVRREQDWLNKLWPKFHMHFMEDDQYYMSARMTGNNKNITYIMAQGKNDFKENGVGYYGKIKGNFLGTVVNVYGSGYSPQDYKKKDVQLRYILATVEYETNFFGTTRPRNFKAYIMKPGCTYYENLVGPVQGEEEIPLNQLYKIPENRDKISVMVNRKAEWNEKIKAYVLNFGGRVKKPSVKNFIMEAEGNPDDVKLVFGKVSDNEFRLDIANPISPLVGLGIALSTFGGKIACQ